MEASRGLQPARRWFCHHGAAPPGAAQREFDSPTAEVGGPPADAAYS